LVCLISHTITLAARHKLPAVYPFRYFVTSGGLISYGPDPIDQYRRAAGYVDRIFSSSVSATSNFLLGATTSPSQPAGHRF
jgi:hypothetical protein